MGLLRSVDDAHKQATDMEAKTTQAYSEEVRNLRLRAIKIDELKRHAAGLRLAALKNAGINDLSQMRGWGAQRLMQVRGIGPDSAHRIASIVDSIIRQSDQQPIPHPVEGPMSTAGYKVLEAVHVDIQTQMTFREPKAQLQSTITDFQLRQARVHSQTGFLAWFPGVSPPPADRHYHKVP